jgi:DNA-binding MarR family transcriptional regulator
LTDEQINTETVTSTQRAYLDPMHSIGYLSRINFRAFSRALEKLTIKHGVTAGQWRFLRVLWEGDNITQRELSNRAGTTEATTVRAVNGLVKSGFVTRNPCADDKRKSHIVLTPRARQLRETLIPMVVQVNSRAMKGLSKKDIETTRRVLEQTYANLTADLEKQS